MARWRDYDDALSGLEAFCEQWLEEEEQQDGEAEEASETEAAGETQPDLAQEERSKRLAKLIFSERQAVATYRTLIAACEGNLRVLTIDPEWVLSLPALVSRCSTETYFSQMIQSLPFCTGTVLGQAGEMLPSPRFRAPGGSPGGNQGDRSLGSEKLR